MAEKDKNESVSIIDIGSNDVRLLIAQKGKSKIEILENLKYSLNLARDAFSVGMISFEKVNKMCEIILNFLVVCKEYGVKNIRIVATTAIRESSNKAYILDQIKIKTGQDVKIIDDNTEKLYFFKTIDNLLKSDFAGSVLMGYTGSGSVGIAFRENENMALIQNIKIGALRISELFEYVYDKSPEFYLMIEEYLATFTDDLYFYLPKNIQYFITTGNEAPLIANLCKAEKKGSFYYIKKPAFFKLYDEIKVKSFDTVAAQYQMSLEKAETLLPSMGIYKNLLSFTSADTIIMPILSLSEILAHEILYNDEYLKITKAFSKNITQSAIKIAEKFNISTPHYLMVEEFSNKIFDKMKKIHGLDKQDRLLLQVAAILHDCGKFVNVKDHHIHSYNLIKGSDIAGLTVEEMDIVANISLYHSRLVPSQKDDNYMEFKNSKRVLVSKLVAILRLADALDRSLKQKFSNIEVKIIDNQLIINVSSYKNVELERWAFEEKGMFFKEVFGMEPVLKVRRVV